MVKSRSVGSAGPGPRSMSAVSWAAAVYFSSGVAVAMQVTPTGPQTIQTARGEKVTLECLYSQGHLDIGELDIEWSLVSPDMTQKDNLILSFTGGRKWLHGGPALISGLDFRVGDPSQGDASIIISTAEVSHTGTYQCKVKSAPGVDMRKVTLLVLVPPSVPKCWAVGSQSVGGILSLHCKSSQGSAPLQYLWVKEGMVGIHPSIAQDSMTGELHISNHSEALAGIYRCEASNAVGTELCSYILNAEKPPSRAGVITGVVIGVLLLVIILLLLSFLLIYRYGKWCKDKEVANDIREDSPPPVSRPHSRLSGLRPGVAYSSVRSLQPWGESEFSSDLTNTSKLKSPSSVGTGTYNSRYGHPV